MNNIRKLSALLIVAFIGFISIYADGDEFTTNNNTSSSKTVTLTLQSTNTINQTIPQGGSMPVTVGSDHVVGLTLFGTYVPAGVNISVPNPSGGSVAVSWSEVVLNFMGVASLADMPPG